MHCGKKFPKIVIGNKSDLKEDREVTFEEGKQFADSINSPFIESSAKENINVQQSFLSLLIEINKIENNFDINKICCPGIFQCVIKNEKCAKLFCYLFYIINLILGICSILLGVYAASFTNLDNDMQPLIIIIVGLWNIIFAVFGFIGIKNQKGDIMNIIKIGITVDIVIAIAGIFTYKFIFYIGSEQQEEAGKKYIALIKMFEYLFTPVIIFFNIIALLFSFIYKKIFELDLFSYII